MFVRVHVSQGNRDSAVSGVVEEIELYDHDPRTGVAGKCVVISPVVAAPLDLEEVIALAQLEKTWGSQLEVVVQ